MNHKGLQAILGRVSFSLKPVITPLPLKCISHFSCRAISVIKITKKWKKVFIFKIFLATLIERRWNVKTSALALIWCSYEALKECKNEKRENLIVFY